MIRVRTWRGLQLTKVKVFRKGGLDLLRQYLEAVGHRPAAWLRMGQTIFIDIHLEKEHG